MKTDFRAGDRESGAKPHGIFFSSCFGWLVGQKWLRFVPLSHGTELLLESACPGSAYISGHLESVKDHAISSDPSEI